jgi:hypothetical protein
VEQEQAAPSLRVLMRHEEKPQTPLSSELLNATLKGLALLSRHFRRELDDLETQTYLQGLRDLKPAEIEKACMRALETMKRMPVIADLRELVNEKGEEAIYTKLGPEVDPGPSATILEMRVIARQIAPERCGKPYGELSDMELLECAAEATKIRFQRLKEGS